MDHSTNSSEVVSKNTTLVQDLGYRRYETSQRTVGHHHLTTIMFTPSGLTVIMSPSHPQHPAKGSGNGKLELHRKLLPEYGKFLHWVTIAFAGTDGKLNAQIVLPGRLAAACQMTEGGAAAAFVNPPFRPIRRQAINLNRRRKNKTINNR